MIMIEISQIEEINVVLIETAYRRINFFLGSVESIYLDKTNGEATVVLFSGETVRFADNEAYNLLTKIWLDYLNGNSDSSSLKRVPLYKQETNGT